MGKRDKTIHNKYVLLPLLFVLVIVPLVVRGRDCVTGLNGYAWGTTDSQLDIFLFWKGRLLVIAAAVMAALLAAGFYKKKLSLKKQYWIWLLLAFLGLVAASAAASPYAAQTLSGTMGQYESVLVVFSYVFVAVYAGLFLKEQKDLELLGRGLLVLTLLLSVLGLSQITGHDFFGTSVGKRLIMPDTLEGYQLENMSYTFAEDQNHRVYLTLYNPNYVGVFAALLLPVLTAFFFYTKKWGLRLLFAAATVGILVAAIGCGSRAFLLTIPVLLVLVLLFLRGWLRRHWKPATAVAAVFVLAVCGFYMKLDRSIMDYLKSGFDLVEEPYAVDDFYADESGVHLVCRGSSMLIRFGNERIAAASGLTDGYAPQESEGASASFLDAMGQPLKTYFDGEALRFEQEAFRDLSVYSIQDNRLENDGMIMIQLTDGQRMLFSRDANGYHFVTENMVTDVPVTSEKTKWLGEHYHFFNRRGYIWAHAIPLMKEHLLLGSGPDTFVYEFPQNDYVARLQSENMQSITTRPHNMYIQMEIQYGLLALLCFLGAVFLYIVDCFRIYWGNKADPALKVLGIGFLCGITGYMICGISNDSTVAVAPVFWAFLGIGFAVNRIAAAKAEAVKAVKAEPAKAATKRAASVKAKTVKTEPETKQSKKQYRKMKEKKSTKEK